MNRDQVRALISQTLSQAFDKPRFGNFAINLLNRIDGSKAQAWNSQYVKDAFKDHVQRYERLGTYTSPDNEKLDVLIVHLTKESKLERARTAIRNFVADHLKTRDEKDAALVAFVSPTEQQWRFSYVKMEYATVEKETGKVGVETRLTPARRFSYLVGEGESCHTAQTRFLKLLQDTDSDPALADIEQAFSVEAVTKEFFTKYAELFGDINKALEKLVEKEKAIRDEFKAKNISTVDFAKKLMGQIVFLYFLQKKGWLGVAKGQDWGAGPHDFLRCLVNGDHAKYDNFFNDILEPLFYDTLAIDRGHEAWCHRFKCRIPFLDGGLFEPLGDYDWCKTDIILPNRLFTNNDFIEEGIKGSGLLDVFDRYNFTVNEAEPLEKEVAIDPEMLGKVFENLIEENRRKGLGAYYTPREIVHYMCQESLINYLDTAINTCPEPFATEKPGQPQLFGDNDPEQTTLEAVEHMEIVPRADIETFIRLGDQAALYEAARLSGTKSYRLHLPKSIEKHARLIDEKLADITICDPAVGSGAFPVGMMTEIVRARSSLTPYFNDVHERTPYHFKRHAIQNCLYGVDIDPGAVEIAKLRLWLSLVVDEEETKQIKPLPNLDYKVVGGNSLIGFPFKSQRLHEIERLKIRFFDEADHDAKATLKQQIDRKLKECFAASKSSLGYEVNFDFEVYFSEVFDKRSGFDVVVGNPPYVRIQELNQSAPDHVAYFKTHYASAKKGNYDLYVVFVERSLQLLQPHGHFSFILPHKFFNAQYGQLLRGLIQKGNHLRHVVHFGDQQIFPGATNYVCLLFLDKAGADSCRFVRVENLEQWLATFQSTEGTIPAERVTDAEWNFAVGKGAELFQKLAAMPLKLGALADIFVGLQTSADTVYMLEEVAPIAPGLIKVKDRDGSEWVLETALLKPLLSHVTVSSYDRPTPGHQLIFPYQLNGTRAELMDKEVLAKHYPRVWAYLRHNSETLRKREGGKWNHDQWYAFGRTQNLSEMEKPKLIVQVISQEARYAYDDNGTYFTGGGNGPYYGVRWSVPDSPYSLHYLQGLLNSKPLDFYLHRISSPFRGGYWSYGKRFIEQLPIHPINFADPAERAEHDAFVRLVERILAVKRTDPRTDTTALEREIDERVYRLYGLSPDEIKLVEESMAR